MRGANRIPGSHARLSLLPAIVALAFVAASPASAAADPALSAQATQAEVPLGAASSISGTLIGETLGNAGVPVELQASPYPFGSFATVANSTTAADGSYSFKVSPDRNTHY